MSAGPARLEGLTHDERASVASDHFDHTDPLLDGGTDETRSDEVAGLRIAFEDVRHPP